MCRIVMKMHQNTKKSKLCFDAMTLLLLVGNLENDFFPYYSHFHYNLRRYDIKVKYLNQCALHSSGVLIRFLYFSDEDDCWSSTLHFLCSICLHGDADS